MKPFSALKYFSRNKRRTATVLVVIMGSVAVVSFIASLLSSLVIDAGKANLEQLKGMSYVLPSAGDEFIQSSVVSEVSGFVSVAVVYDVAGDSTYIDTLIGQTRSLVLTPYNTSDIPSIMADMGVSLASGRLPQPGNDYEIVMSQRLLLNKGLKVGDSIGSDVDPNEYLTGSYKIVGALSGAAIVSFTNKNTSLDALEQAGLRVDQPVGLVVVPKPGQLDAMNAQLDRISSKDAMVTTYTSMQRQFNAQLASFTALVFIVIVTVVLIISISISALIYIVYMGRSVEFGIMSAMGYRKSFIRNLVLKEIAALAVVCWALGYAFSYVVFLIVNAVLLAPKGQTLYFFTTSGLLYTLVVPGLVIACATIPILRRLSRWDAIAVIERRD